MSTFSLLVMLLFLLTFIIRVFMYCDNIEMPRLSGFMTLLLLLMILAELVIAVFEFPAVVIDGIILICMGNKAIAIGCGIVIATVAVFIFVMLYPKLPWKKILSFSPLKYAVIGILLISLAIYTELFNGSYSFDSMDEYREFKQTFAAYDRHFWPTKFIKHTEDNGRDFTVTYSIYPWDVEIDDGRQFAYKVITFYSTDESHQDVFNYYPFTYNLYAGVSSLPVEHSETDGQPNTATVSNSDAGGSDTDDDNTGGSDTDGDIVYG